MARENFNDLWTFAVIAKARSFTRASAELGVSQSALSQTMRSLEERLGYRLLIRTTRSVSTTEAGERLLNAVLPRLEDIQTELVALGDLSGRPAGTVRITCSEFAAETVLWPKLRLALAAYPDITVEIYVDHGFTDIAAERFDAGVRLGESVEKDMIAVRIAPDSRLVPAAAPAYLAGKPLPELPQDLVHHTCIGLRLATQGGLYAWEFARDNRPLRVRVTGQLVFNTIRLMVNAAVAGYGIAFVPESAIAEHVARGELIQLLDDWCPPIAGFHLYYPSRRQNSAAFQVIVDILRYRA